MRYSANEFEDYLNYLKKDNFKDKLFQNRLTSQLEKH